MAKNLKLRDLKKKTPQELLVYAEELGVENASSMRTQDMPVSYTHLRAHET